MSLMALVAGVVLAGCGGEATEGGPVTPADDKATVQVTVTDPSGLLAGSVTQHLFLFDGDCPSDDELAYGIVAGAIFTQTVPQLGTAFTMAKLEKKKTCFAAIFRKADCAVSAFGSVPTDLSVHKSITIEVSEVIPPVGACANGLSCVAGACKAN